MSNLTLNTPGGEIRVIHTGSPEYYPGFWIQVNGQDLILVDYDNIEEKHVIRVWNQDKENEDPEYRQIIENKKEEVPDE